MSLQLTSSSFLSELEEKSGVDFLYTPNDNERIGVKMKGIFDLAKEYKKMSLPEVEKLLKHGIHDAKVGAVSILDFVARDTSTDEATRKALYNMYMNNHDQINTWDLVDRAAPYVIGGYLYDKSREPLYTLAKSTQPMERRTAIVATYYFIRQNDIDDTFKIAELLAGDADKYVQMAIGSWLREAGKRDTARLVSFLQTHKSKMSSKAIRYATEKLSGADKKAFQQ